MICKDLLTDAVLIPCCGTCFCDECIRFALLESDHHECPVCHELDQTPDKLIPNRFLRNKVSRLRGNLQKKKEDPYAAASAAVAGSEDVKPFVKEETSQGSGADVAIKAEAKSEPLLKTPNISADHNDDPASSLSPDDK